MEARFDYLVGCMVAAWAGFDRARRGVGGTG